MANNDRNFVEVENFFEDRCVAERYLNRSMVKQHPPGRGYGSDLIKLYRETAVQLIVYGGDFRWRNKARKLARVQELGDKIFFHILRVYSLCRDKYHKYGAATDDPSKNDDEEDDEDEDDEENRHYYYGSDDEDEEDDSDSDSKFTAANPNATHAPAASHFLELRSVDFFFVETEPSCVGDGSSVHSRGVAKFLSKRDEQAKTMMWLYQLFRAYVHSRRADDPEDGPLLKMLRPSLNPNEAAELMLLSEGIYEIVKRQKIIVGVYDDSLLTYAECIEYEKCVHSFYLTKLQLLSELRANYNGNELHKDWLLVNEILNVRELDMVAYEKMINFSRVVLRPPYTVDVFAAYTLMSDNRTTAIHQLVTRYFHETYVIAPDSNLTPLTSASPQHPTTKAVLELIVNRCFMPRTNGGGNQPWIRYPEADQSLSIEFQQENNDRYWLELQAFWKPVFVHCICLFPSMFISCVHSIISKRETSWEIGIHDVLRYVDSLAYQDYVYVCYTQKMIYRYMTYEANVLHDQFAALYDTECVLFALYVRNRYSAMAKQEEIFKFVSARVNTETDLPDRKFRNGYTTAEQSSPLSGQNGYPYNASTSAAANGTHMPFTYDWRHCQNLPNPNLNYRMFVESLYDLSVYRDSIQFGLEICVAFVEQFGRNSGNDNDGALPPIASRSLNEQKQENLILNTALQIAMNFLNRTCWLFDGNFFHLHNANSYTVIDRKRFAERLKLYNPELRAVQPTMSFDAMNFEEMIKNCYRFATLNSAKFAKIQKIIGNTQATNNKTSVNFSFLRINHESQRVIMMNVHTNMYELVGPSVLYLLALDTKSFYTDDGEHFPFAVNQNTVEFTLDCFRNLPEYLRQVTAIDSFSLMLHAPLVIEKKHESIFASLRTEVVAACGEEAEEGGNGYVAGEKGGEGGENGQVGGTTTAAVSSERKRRRKRGGGEPDVDESEEPGEKRRRKKRKSRKNDWDSFIGLDSRRPSAPINDGDGEDDEEVSSVSCGSVVSRQTTTSAGPSSAPMETPSATTAVARQHEQFIPFTIDREEFFMLSKHLNIEWAHQTYAKRKSLRLFVATMMQVLNEYGEQLITRQNGLRLSVNALLRRLGNGGGAKKRPQDLFADTLRDDDVVSDYEDDEGKEEDDDGNGGGGGGGEGAGDEGAGGVKSASRRKPRKTVETASTSAGSFSQRLNLSSLLDVNVNATGLSQFLNNLVKHSMSDTDMFERTRDYFRRLPNFAKINGEGGGGKPVTDGADKDDDEGAGEGRRVWCNYLNADYRVKGKTVRPIHEELMFMDNFMDLLYDLFHDEKFFDWVTDVVNRGDLCTNNLLDFSDECFRQLFTGYLYVLRMCDRESSRKSSKLVLRRDATGRVSAVERKRKPRANPTLYRDVKNPAISEDFRKQTNFPFNTTLGQEGGQSSGVGGQSSGVGGQSLGVGGKNLGVGGQSLGVDGQSLGVGGKNLGVGGQSLGVDGQSLGVDGQSRGVGGQSRGVGGQSRGVGDQSRGVGDQSRGVGDQSLGVDGQNLGVGGQGIEGLGVNSPKGQSSGQGLGVNDRGLGVNGSGINSQITGQNLGAQSNDQTGVGAQTTAATTSGRSARTLSQYFYRHGSAELAELQAHFVSRQVSSPNLINLSTGFRKYMEHTQRRHAWPTLRPLLSPSKRDSICYFIVCLYTFCDCNLAYALYVFRLIMSVKFPGCWSKTLHLMQGSSNSGKSEFIEYLRAFFNSTGGVINPNVWRSTTSNDIGTSLFPLMENLLCQSDEVDFINNTLLKTVISKTAKQSRSFGSQETQQLQNMSKVFLSTNKLPQIDQSDEGVLTRMQVLLPVFHKYLPLISRDTDTTKKCNLSSFSPSLQLTHGVYPVGSQQQSYASGLFHCFQHFGQYTVNRNVTVFRNADALNHAHLHNFLLGRRPVKLSYETVGTMRSNRVLLREAFFIASHTNVQNLAEMLTKGASTTNSDGWSIFNEDERYFLTTDLVQTIDSRDQGVYVNLTTQPVITTLFREDVHANIDPMVKFDALYTVSPAAKSVDWILIERLLRDHLIDFYNNEDRGDLGVVQRAGGGDEDDDGDVLRPLVGAVAGGGSSKKIAGEAGGTGAGSWDDVSANSTKLSRKINFKAFYDRFKNRFSHLQERDQQTRHLVPNKWALTIRRNK